MLPKKVIRDNVVYFIDNVIYIRDIVIYIIDIVANSFIKQEITKTSYTYPGKIASIAICIPANKKAVSL